MPHADGAGSLRVEAIASARERFLQWGYSGASISTIAEDLGVTKAALYYHFPDKEALFLAVFDDYLSGVAADLAALAPRFEAGGADRSPVEPRIAALEAFRGLATVFLSRGAASAKMDRLAFQESRHLGEAGRSTLGGRYHRDLVKPLMDCFALAERAHWIRPAREGEPARVWLFMGLLSAFFAPGHESWAESDSLIADLERDAAAFAHVLLGGIGN